MSVASDHTLVIALPSEGNGSDGAQLDAAANVKNGAVLCEVNVKAFDGQKRRVEDVNIAICTPHAKMRTRGGEGQAIDDGSNVFCRACMRVFQRQPLEGLCKRPVGLEDLVKVHLLQQ